MTDQMLMGPLGADETVAPGKRMSNSTYLALACANAVSQGSMTRKFRAIFEQQPAKDPPPLLSRAQVQQAIHESRMRRNSIACSSPSSPSSPPLPAQSITQGTDPTTPTTPTKPVQQMNGRPGLRGCVSPGDHVSRHLKQWTSPADNQNGDFFARQPRSKSYTSPSSPSSVSGEVRCDKCLSILPSPPVSPVPPAPQQTKQQHQKPAQQQQPVQQPIQPVPEEEKKLAVVPANREVNEEELPKPDTVKNARCLFESSLVVDGYSTLQHVKSNPSSKILRSESTMTLDRAGSRHHQQPYRWPARSETGSVRNRSPSPSLSTSPVPTAPFKTSKSSIGPAFYYRSTPSLYQNRPPPQQQQRPAARQHNARHSRHSRHSTDVESYVSESECWSSDLESEVGSYGTGSHSSGRDHPDQADMDGMRYIAPDVMEKIRSYGMTLTFVNGKMVDEDAEEDDEEEDVGQNYKATQKVVQSIRSAGQSQPTTKTTTTTTAKPAAQPVAPSPVKKVGPKVAPKQQQPARIVACVPKSSSEKKRHSSGESSASSGISSADSSPSPFASLKRTAASTAIHNQQGHEEDRCPSPDLLSKDARKSHGSSPFGSYSVVYEFASSNSNKKIQHHRSPMYV